MEGMQECLILMCCSGCKYICKYTEYAFRSQVFSHDESFREESVPLSDEGFPPAGRNSCKQLKLLTQRDESLRTSLRT